MSKQAYYFPHDSNAKDDPKCVLLIEQLGLEGYGVYWVLVETLRDQPNYSYPIQLIPALARRYNTTAEKMKTVVFNYGLFSVQDDEFFFSESLVNRMIPLEKKREQARLAGKKSAERRALTTIHSTDVQHRFNGRSTSVQPEEKRRVKKSKENIIVPDKDFIIEKVNILYSLYPAKCLNRGKSTGKSYKDKEKIKALLKSISFEELEYTINAYVKQCSETKEWLKNFSTFLNNLPDMDYLKNDIVDTRTEQQKRIDEYYQ